MADIEKNDCNVDCRTGLVSPRIVISSQNTPMSVYETKTQAEENALGLSDGGQEICERTVEHVAPLPPVITHP